MANGTITAVPRQDPAVTNQNVESIEQDRDVGGVRLVQTVAIPCLVNAQAPTHDQINLSTEQVILASNDKRLDAVIVNMGSEIVYLFFGPTGPAAIASHIPLYPTEKVHLKDFTHAGVVRAIAASGTQDIRIVEFHLP